MSWRAITTDDVRSAINAAEDTAVRTNALAEGQADPYAAVVLQVTDMFRGAIRSGPGNRLDETETTLPPVAIYHAVAKIRFRLLTRFAAELLDDDRRTENKEAEKWLSAVRSGAEKIEQPGDGPGEGTTPSMTLLSSTDRGPTRQSLAGL